MPIVKTFEYVEDQETGSLGWRLKGSPEQFNAGGGMLVAHDCLEHFWDGKVDRWEDELLALGAMIFIRWEPGYFSGRYYTGLADNLGAELDRCFEFIYGDRDLKPKRRYRIGNEEIDNGIDEAIEKGFEEWLCYHFESNRVDLSDQFGNIRGWLREGYRRAKRRYKHGSMAACLFHDLQEKVDQASRRCDLGDQIKVSVNISRFSSKVDLIRMEDEYEYY